MILSHSFLSNLRVRMCRICPHYVWVRFASMVVVKHHNVTLACRRIKICELVHGSFSWINYVVSTNVLLYNLGFVSLVPIIIALSRWFFVFQTIPMILWSWSQKLFWRIASHNNVFLAGSVALVSTTNIIFRLLLMHLLIVSGVILFNCSAETTLSRHPVIVFCSVRLNIEVMMAPREKLLLRDVHIIRYVSIFP